MTSTSAPPAQSRPKRRPGDRVFAGSATGAGILILLVLAGVAAFLISEAWPAVTAPAADTWTAGAVEEWPTSGGEAANGTSGVIQAETAGAGTIGYADESQAGSLGVAKIGVGSAFVAPSAAGAAAVVANSDRVPGRGQYDFAVAVNRTTTSADEYPIVLVSYHIGCVSYDDQATAGLVKAFEAYVISQDGQQAAAKAAGSAPISDELRTQAQTAVDAITSAR